MATRKRTATRSAGPGISRIDQAATRTHGYFVRLGYRKTTKGWRPKLSAFFGDVSHGGQSKALRAARAWREEMAKGAGRKAKSGGASRSSARGKTGARKKAGRKSASKGSRR